MRFNDLLARLAALDDARRTVRRISIARAMHERITPADGLARLDASYTEGLAMAAGT